MLLVLGASAAVGRAGSVLPTTGLVAWWKGDGDFTDAIAARNGTSVGGAGFAAGKYGQAFDLGNGYITVPDDDVWTITGDFTIVLWAQWSQLDSGSVGQPEDVFISHDEGGGYQHKWFFAKGGGQLNFHINTDGGASAFLAETPFAPVLNQWYHLAVRRTGNTFGIFVDGVESAFSEDYSGVIPNAVTPLRIGKGEAFNFNGGLLDDVAIYSRSLGDSEIQDIADPPAAPIPEPMTMVGVFLGISGLAGYVRRRRQSL